MGVATSVGTKNSSECSAQHAYTLPHSRARAHTHTHTCARTLGRRWQTSRTVNMCTTNRPSLTRFACTTSRRTSGALRTAARVCDCTCSITFLIASVFFALVKACKVWQRCSVCETATPKLPACPTCSCFYRSSLTRLDMCEFYVTLFYAFFFYHFFLTVVAVCHASARPTCTR